MSKENFTVIERFSIYDVDTSLEEMIKKLTALANKHEDKYEDLYLEGEVEWDYGDEVSVIYVKGKTI